MNTILKRLVSLLLCFVLVAGYLPAGAFAAETEEAVTAETTAVTEEPTQAASEETEAPSESKEESTEQSEQTDVSAKEEKKSEKEAKQVEKEAEKEAKQESKQEKTVSEEETSGVPTASAEAAAISAEAVEPSTEATEPEVIAVTGITLDQTALEVGVGELPMTLTATVLPENATDKTVTWVSSEPGVASVEDGVLTFGYMGKAVITATAGEFSASCTVTVDEGEAAVYESEYVDAVVFASDIHDGPDTAESIMQGVAQSGLTYSTATFVGDTFSDSSGDVDEDVTPYIQSGLGNESVEVLYAWGDHDYKSDIENYTGLLYGDSTTNYYIYTISMSAMTDMSDSKTGLDSTFSDTLLTTFTNDVAAMDHTKPLFIATHMPLHTRRGDNDYAYDWYQVIEAAAKKMDVVVFWAHNHTGDTGNNYDSTCYYMEPGTSINIQGAADAQTLNFTYANAGYINPPNGSGRKNVATSVTIFDDKMEFVVYDANGAYSSSTYATGGTVERLYENTISAPTLTSIAITTLPTKTEYYVGDAFSPFGMVVTATYSDGTTKTVSEYSYDVDMSKAGTATVTVVYEEDGTEYTATTSITIKAVELNSIAVTTQPTKLTYTVGEELDTTGMVVTGTYNNGTTAEVTGWYVSNVDMTTVGEKEVTVNYVVDGITFKTTFTITVEQGVAEGVVLEKIDIANPPAKTEYLLSQELDLDGMIVVATFSDGSTVELAYKPFSTSTVYGGYELDNFSMYVEKGHEMVVTYTFGEVTCTDTTTINVWSEDFADETTGVKVHVAEGDYGVTDVNVSPSGNSYVASALADVMKGGTLVAYDITLALDADTDEAGEAVYALTNGEKTVTLPIPSGVTNPVVYYVSDDGKTVTNMNAVKDGNGNVTFTTTHFSTYVIGESTEIEVPENETASGSDTATVKEEKTVFVLVSTPTAGKQYIIVSSGSAGTGYALKENTTTGTSVTINAASGNITAPYIETSDKTIMWNATTGLNFQSENGGYYLNYSNSSSGSGGPGSDKPGSGSSFSLSFSTSSPSNWTAGTNQLYRNGQNNDYWLCYSNGWTMGSSNTTYNVYFYEAQTIEVETTTTVSGTYSIVGKDISVVAAEGTTATLSSTLIFDIEGGEDNVTEDPAGVKYEIVTVDANGNTVDGDPNDIISEIENGVVTFTGNLGTALVKVSYDVTIGGEAKTVTDYITVEAKAPYFTIDLHRADLTEVAADAEFDSNVTYYTFNETTGNYQPEEITGFEEGVTYYTTPVIAGDEITAPIALKGVVGGDTYSVWAIVKSYDGQITEDDEIAASADGHDLGYLGDALHWTVSDESIATIDTETGIITFTGTNYGTFTVTVSYEGSDGKVITDTITISATESLYVVPGDGTDDFPEYPNQGAVRFDKTATAVGNFSETGIAKVELSMTGVPYSTGNAIDVLLMIDMSTSMDTDVGTDDDGSTLDRVDVTIEAAKAFAKTIVQNDDGTYNSNKIAIKYFNGSSVYTTTDYITVSSDAELEALYELIEGLYTPTSTGTYYSTAMQNAYNTVVAQDAASDNTQALVFMSDGGPTYYTYLNDSGTGTTVNSSTGATFVGWFDVDDNDTTDETDDTATPNSDFKTEYYSYLLKKAGYPVYTVGLGLSTNDTGPSSYTGLTSGAHEAITSYILSQMATSSSYFYNVADSDAVDNMGNIFSGIAASIKEAARDVVVEDKIGNNYTVSFGLPDGITSDATDGLEDFYIQVVDYILDSTTHERTGVYTVLENFTFDGETGALKSHTVDGVECTDCDHVTTTNGVITAINGTYFTYKSDGTGEYLTWEAEKLTSTELALQYFAYLDNSAGTDVANQVPAGTYYTNEYATLTYTNVNNKVVQQEFPIPQMTWNGAQVSYVFYLVNEAGQPVNRAGKVIPFAEAVYVTDVYTYSVIWNDMEQAAGLEARYLAEDKVPDAYALYDDDATYQIHVYEDETEVNLNNHFVIGGDVTDDYNTTANAWTNAKTTYVFNAKSDATKYTATGTYVADNGNEHLNQTNLSYFCKSASIEGATFTTSVENDVAVYTVTSVGDGYQTISGETQATVAQITAAGGSTTGGTVIGDYIYYVDENEEVYTIVQKTNGTEVEKGFDFANTTVAFAVVWKPELVEDAVVVDYGLDVVIDVIKNDNMAAGVVGVRADAPANVEQNKGEYTSAKATSVDVYIDSNNDNDSLKENKIGTATVENLNSVRFSLDETNGMQFTDPAVFYYEADVNYYDSSNVLQTTSMYSKVTVIPATTVYYEDEYVDFEVYTDEDDKLVWTDNADDDYNATTRVWDVVGTTASKIQDTDRPGIDKIGAIYDADNNYGYDSAYVNMSTYSMGSARKLTVDSTYFGKAKFSFYGTGFDVIGLTSNQTGVIVIQIKDTSGNVTSKIVDTYYGYTKVNGEWVVSVNEPNALYQVPVMKVDGLDYGKYDVTITAAYNSALAHNNATSYDLYLDAIRIYDPTGVAGGWTEDETVSDAYVADEEGWPIYEEVRNNIIAASSYSVSKDANGNVTVTGDDLAGAIFIDSADGTKSIADYVSYGPNNELYLASGQSVAFEIDPAHAAILADVQIAMKLANGTSATYTIANSANSKTTNGTLTTATDMYYSIKDHVDGVITITNTGDGILSLTNIKVTHTENPFAIATNSLLRMTSAGAAWALRTVTEDETEDEVVEIETTEPESTETETTEPEVTEPEITEPAVTEPETTVPEETEPENDREQVEEAIKAVAQTVVNTVVNALKNLFGRWFR